MEFFNTYLTPLVKVSTDSFSFHRNKYLLVLRRKSWMSLLKRKSFFSKVIGKPERLVLSPHPSHPAPSSPQPGIALPYWRVVIHTLLRNFTLSDANSSHQNAPTHWLEGRSHAVVHNLTWMRLPADVRQIVSSKLPKLQSSLADRSCCPVLQPISSHEALFEEESVDG